MIDIRRDILPLKDMMYRLALRITQNSQEAEDVVQDVIIKLWNTRGSLENITNLEAYAMRMVRNMALDRQRMRANHTESLEAACDKAQQDDDTIERRERLDNIRAVMAQLPEKQRTAMHLRDFEGRSYKDIAEVMGITEDQVKVNIFRARQFVKAKLAAFM
ncbi:MAG: sigma-70 family RNA polymerase sigma factor [Prevotellaceae bacterium]|nr:sigma-70 family RNA polymerase sigma factor [Prevotellaceae bacterium]